MSEISSFPFLPREKSGVGAQFMAVRHAESDQTLVIAQLSDGFPGLTHIGGLHLAQACGVCLEEQGHASHQCGLATRGEFESSWILVWPAIDTQVQRQWNDDQEATEQGACGIAILLVTNLTEYVVVERSRKGTGFDYWLGRKDDDLFQNAARLEVSGIKVGKTSTSDARVRQKLKQTRRSDSSHSTLPAFVVVVEFGTPVAVVAKR